MTGSDRLQAELDAMSEAVLSVIDERDRAQDWADRLAVALAPRDVIGDHSSGNNPWFNALSWACENPRSDAARAAVAERDQLWIKVIAGRIGPKTARECREALTAIEEGA